DRAGAVCKFCDTNFVGTNGPGGGRFDTAEALALAVAAYWPDKSRAYVVCTGGEPLLQLDKELIDQLHSLDCEVAIETNGTIAAPAGVDWICVSPKSTAKLVQTEGDELKLVFPQRDAPPDRFEGLAFDHFFLQPMAGDDLARATELAIDYCKKRPKWRLSLQTHKFLAIR
ncbi:MAG TPA: 7-carboxy-7-deazaguanine synthase, partial [Caulobacterales bacterium]|nr:7-carboxy-7-deazaguanine synthase [Caulobacterales bacterium]